MKIFKLILLLVVVTFGYLVYSLGLFGTPKAKDLGIEYSSGDFVSARQKAKIAFEDKGSTNNPASAISFSGSHETKESYTSQELTAIANERSWQYLPFSNIQIKLGDGGAEISGNLDTSKVVDYLQAVGGMSESEASAVKKYIPISGRPAFYLKVGGSVINNNLDLEISSLSIGSIQVPSGIIGDNQGRVESFLESRARAFPGFSVTALDIKAGELNFDGTLPDTESLSR